MDFDGDPNAALRQAMALHRQGALAEASALYDRLLRQFPQQPQVFYLAGMAALQRGQAEDGVRHLTQALRLQPNEPQTLAYRGVGWLHLNRPAEALADCDRALALAPDLIEAHGTRGNALKVLGRPEEALASYDRALALAPRQVAALVNRGNVLDLLGRYEEARASFVRALAQAPQDVAALCGLCKVLSALDRPQEALRAGEDAVRRAPGRAEAYNNRGQALQKLHRPAEALADFDRALALAPDSGTAHNNRCSALYDLKRPQEALPSGLRAVQLIPDSADAHNTLGSVYRDLLQLDAARDAYERALALAPDDAVAHWNRALLNLLTGRFAEGWDDYEWRWKGPEMRAAVRPFAQPRWQGEDIAGQRVLLHAEQGLGDTVQFCRYAPLVAARGAHVILEAPREVLRLLATLPGGCTLVATGDPLPAFDWQCPLMSLPRAFHTDAATIPSDIPYLAADPQRRARWAAALGTKTKPRIGLVWSGRAGLPPDRIRSLPLALLAPLLALPYEFHALQKEIRPDDAAVLSRFPALQTHTDDLGDFADTAALIAEMDLTISVDTAAAHVAGALGAPLWLLLSWTGEWRWQCARTDSPWYPSATLLRQPAWGDWARVVATAAERLQARFG